MSPGPQKVLDRLAKSEGAVDRWELVRQIDPRPTTADTIALRVYINTIRLEIGYECIKTVWGRGYQLTEIGRRVLSERSPELVTKRD